MNNRDFKDIMYDGLSKLLKALANPSRLEIIEMLSQGEKSVETIVQNTGLTIANASQHLQVLKNSNIVKSRKEKHYVIYSLANNELLALYQQVIKYAVNEIAELEKTIVRQREDNKALNAVSVDELEIMIQSDNILLLDVRPSAEYESGHISGAISVPLNNLTSQLRNLSNDKEIIAYCRGPFCVLADEAVKILNEEGYRVRRLDQGYPEWSVNQL
jgi:rhodanese-related sulfurtransferase/DNA-binding transcriptional ArsR family regulator